MIFQESEVLQESLDLKGILYLMTGPDYFGDMMEIDGSLLEVGVQQGLRDPPALV